MFTTNQPLSEEERELIQEYGGHEPHVGEALFVALRKDQNRMSRQSLLEAERQTYQQRVRAFLAEHAEGSD